MLGLRPHPWDAIRRRAAAAAGRRAARAAGRRHSSASYLGTHQLARGWPGWGNAGGEGGGAAPAAAGGGVGARRWGGGWGERGRWWCRKGRRVVEKCAADALTCRPADSPLKAGPPPARPAG